MKRISRLFARQDMTNSALDFMGFECPLNAVSQEEVHASEAILTTVLVSTLAVESKQGLSD